MNAADFETFFEELHGVSPFPWQKRLMKRVAETGWPAVLDLPTSAGKTAALDVALFHLALEADNAAREDRAPRRIFFVVDRRLVVDEAHERACRIRDRLREALRNGQGVLAQVARRLVMLVAEESVEPVEVIRLRGGLPREHAFIRNPLQPAIVLSTVDQVGSRLLFRGYGVSEFMRPIHAALAGVDSLIILDEAHLSRAFVETLRSVRRYQSEAWAERVVGKPVTVVEMTATPPPGEDDIFTLEDKDWDHGLLGQRLKRPKLAELVPLDSDKDDRDAVRAILVETLASEARSLMTAAHGTSAAPVVGVVANRVATARQVFERLSREEETDAVLLTGRIRPFEREELLKAYLPRIKAGRDNDANPRSLYVVATQTVEVGADLDFDALVTEAAALDALRQRFGRLNRLGRREHSQAVIVYVKLRKGDEADPVYGEALIETWKWMEKRAAKPKGKKGNQARKVLDFCMQAMQKMLPGGDDLAKMLTPGRPAPVLMPAHMDMLVQTSPTPAVEPETALYLHGKGTEREDVQIVWRADLPETLKPDDENAAIATVCLPPVQLEALAIPVWAARAFLEGNLQSPDIPDVEGAAEAEDVMRGRHPRYAVRWRGPEESRLIGPGEVRPGDTLVIPASYGGYDRFGWHPGHHLPVTDIADYVAWQRRGKHVLRVHRDLIPQWFEAEAEPERVSAAVMALEDVIARHAEGEDLSELCGELIERLRELPHLRSDVRDALTVLQANRRELVYPTVEKPRGILLQERKNVAHEFTDEDDASSLTREVLLENHCKGVGELARALATHIGLSGEFAEDVMLAGRLHDLGKADPRFQAWLRGGDRIAAREAQRAGILLAKSDRLGATDPIAVRIAREQAGYPQGQRHECYSAAIASRNGHVLDDAHDRELVLYLIGVHHGRGRPFMPAVEDEGMKQVGFEFDGKRLEFSGSHRLERLGHGWPQRFWGLVRRYGYWGLAYLETLVRLADHRRSEQGE